MITERLPRADNFSDLSEYSNFALRTLVEKSPMNRRIKVVPMEPMQFTTDRRLSEIFGSPSSSNFDGIHPKGKLGRRLYNNCLISALKTAGISNHRERMETQEPLTTPVSNMCDVLN